MLRIVHLSDIHLNLDSFVDFEEFILTALIEDLKEYDAKEKIDIIVFSGDLIDKGGKSFGNTKEALDYFEQFVIEQLSNGLKLPKENFFFAPGNHDINPASDEDYVDIGLTGTILSTEDVNEYIDSGKTNGIMRVIQFKEFEKAFYSKYNNYIQLTNFNSTFNTSAKGFSVGINCINTSWRSYDSKTDKGKLLIGERQFTKSSEMIKNCDVTIAIMHHSIDWLKDFDKRNSKDFLNKEYSIVLCGHIHEGDTWSQSSMYGNTFISVAPSNWAENIRSDSLQHANGYSIIDYDLKKGTITNNLRRYSYKRKKYVPNADLGADDGKAIFNIPTPVEVSNLQHKLTIVRNIEDLHIDNKNEHLLSYNTNTNAPKNINDLFVLPIIIKKEEHYIENKDNEKQYTLEDICSSDHSTMIFGMKESGKTILLDKIFIEITTKVEKYKKVPVYIDFANFSHARIETAISLFLNIKITEIDSFLSSENIVLLIDNLEFNIGNSKKIRIFQDFVCKYHNIYIIFMSSFTFLGNIPDELFSYSELASFEILEIKSFRTSQIRSLMKKWFKNANSSITPEKLENILKAFYTFNLPCTPLAASMFLWIIERQENYKPINNANMLENFVEKLFEKSSKAEIYSDKFDFHNKQRLLADIAYTMYKSDRENYALTYNDMITFVHDYLYVKKFGIFDHVKLIEDFLSIGLFVKDQSGNEELVRFRFNCIFEYYLTKKMEYDEDFKKFVLSEKNYLCFVDEIDYFTGLNRAETDILNKIISRMDNKYGQLIDSINSEEFGFDSFFEVSVSYAGQFNIEDITHSNKPTEQEMDKMSDDYLDDSEDRKDVVRKEDLTPIQKLERIWILAAKVLKNSEEVEEEGLKYNSLKKVIQSSMAFAVVFKDLTIKFLKNNEDINDELKERLNLQIRFLPYLHEEFLHYVMGTYKLSTVLQEKIESEMENNEISVFEKFINVFLYSDIYGPDYNKYINSLIDSTRKNYILDASLLKIMSYYSFRSKTKNEDKIHENLLGDIYLKSHLKGSRGGNNLGNDKSEAIDKYRTIRKQLPDNLS